MTTAAAPKIEKSSPGHGGARPGAGRPAGYSQSNPAQAYEVLAKAKAKRETHRAQLAELEYRQKVGELVEASEVARRWANIGNMIRQRLLAIPTRLAAQVAGMDDERMIRDAIKSEVYAALTELSASVEAGD
jgi:phage terminase Nu1 subunit (DNA packaging protein)